MKTKAEDSKTKILQHEDVWLKENERFVVLRARLRNPVSTPPWLVYAVVTTALQHIKLRRGSGLYQVCRKGINIVDAVTNE